MNDVVLDAYSRGRKGLVSYYAMFLADQDSYLKSSWYHKTMSDYLLEGKGHFAIEAFRESGKSSIVFSYPLYCLTYPRKKQSYIVIVKQNQPLAENKLKELSRVYRGDDVLSANLKEVVQDNGMAFEAIVKDFETEEDMPIRIETYGKGASIRGLNWRNRRPDIVIVDDPQNFEDSISPTTLDRDWKWFMSDIQFLGKFTRIFLIGNNLGAKCIIEMVMDKLSDKYQCLRVPILNDKGESNWKEYMDAEAINSERDSARKAGVVDIWHRERMCMCISEESKKFKKQYFKYYELKETDNIASKCNVYVIHDPAIGENERDCYTAIMVLGVNEDNQTFILDGTYGNFDIDKGIDEAMRLCKKWKKKAGGHFKYCVEREKLDKVIISYLNKRMISENFFFEIEPLSTGGKGKEYRIHGLQPRYASGSMWHPEQAVWLTEYETELEMYPKGSHIDLVDAVAYIDKVGMPYVSSDEIEEEDDDYHYKMSRNEVSGY